MKAIRMHRASEPAQLLSPARGRARSRIRMMAAAIAASTVALGGVAAVAVAAQSAVTCQPGSGAQLAGKTITSAQIGSISPDRLRCANLTGANLSGLSLVQIDLTGAVLRNASLQHADLTQATLEGANLSHANLSNATLDQASANDANFTGANLTGASLTQADLTGANLNGTQLGGADFTQATLDQATFTGATGMTPWSLYLLLAAVAIFILLALFSILGALRSGSLGKLVIALIGSLVAALGFHLFAGGLLTEFIGGFGTPVTQTCSGPLCAVGVSSGFFGIFGGVILGLIGLGLRGSARPKNAVVAMSPGMPGGVMGPNQWPPQ